MLDGAESASKRPIEDDSTSKEAEICPFQSIAKRMKLAAFPDEEEGSSGLENTVDESEENSGTVDTPTEGQDKDSNDDNIFDDFSDIDDLLEADVDDAMKEEKGEYTLKEKYVLKRKPKDLFNVLPDSWIELTHDSGLPVYLHRPSRVCTFGRPYFLGPGSAKHHKVPSSAIPCYYQKRMIEEEDKFRQDQMHHNVDVAEGDDTAAVMQQLNAPMLKIKDTADMIASDLAVTELHDYAKKVFEFKKISYKKFKNWKKARAHFKDLKKLNNHRNHLMSNIERPMLPSDTKIITVPGMEVTYKPSEKEFRMNPAHKTALTVLHEYVQKVLKSSIEYDTVCTGDPTMPYCAIAKIRASKVAQTMIDEHNFRERFEIVREEYKARLTEEGKPEKDINKCLEDMIVVGRGIGIGKKNAKMNAAAVALKLLMPDIYFDDQGVSRTVDPVLEEVYRETEELSIFDQLEIENTMIPELSTKTGQPMPFVILQECLTKCATVSNCKLDVNCEKISHTSLSYTLKLGDFIVKETGSKKLECKQSAAQKVLAKLYPNFKSYGAILRLYGTHMKRQMKDQRLENKEFQKQNIASRASINKLGTKKVESTGRFLESVRNHMVKFAEKPSDLKDDIVNRSKPLTKEEAEELAKKSQEKAAREGDHFLETIPKIWQL